MRSARFSVRLIAALAVRRCIRSAAVGLIGEVVTLVTGFVLPMLYERSGLNQSVAVSLGYDGSNVYDVLYDKSYFISISSVLIIASAVGAALNVIPFFFYDLSETKQKAMVRVLKIRALFEDYGNNVLSNDALIETVDIIKEAEEYCEKEPNVIQKKGADKAVIKEQLEENEKIEIALVVQKELTRFETEYGKLQLENARRMVSAGLDGFISASTVTKAAAKAMPKNTEPERERRREALMQVSQIKASEKAIKKYFPKGIVKFDNSVFDTLFTREDDNELKLHNALNKMKKAKEAKDGAQVAMLKSTVEQLQKERKKIAAEIKEATEKNSVYYRAAKPYLDAEKLLIQAENYSKLDEIFALYEKAKASD